MDGSKVQERGYIGGWEKEWAKEGNLQANHSSMGGSLQACTNPQSIYSLLSSLYGHDSTSLTVLSIVFEGPVYRTEKKTEIGLNWTD